MALRLGSLLAPRARRCASTLAADGSYAVAVDNPYSGETYCEVGYKTSAEALAAVDAGAAAQRAWAAETTVEQRVAVCAKFMEAIKADADRIANDISGMMGKPVAHAKGEIGGMMERCEMMMALAPKALAPELLPAKDNFVRTIEKDPVGVVLCIAPWNYPLLTTVNCVVPAVLAGNAVGVGLGAQQLEEVAAVARERAVDAPEAPPAVVRRHGVRQRLLWRVLEGEAPVERARLVAEAEGPQAPAGHGARDDARLGRCAARGARRGHEEHDAGAGRVVVEEPAVGARRPVAPPPEPRRGVEAPRARGAAARGLERAPRGEVRRAEPAAVRRGDPGRRAGALEAREVRAAEEVQERQVDAERDDVFNIGARLAR